VKFDGPTENKKVETQKVLKMRYYPASDWVI